VQCNTIKNNIGKSGRGEWAEQIETRRQNYLQTQTNYPRTILRYAQQTGHHPTQKPVPLLEYLIRTYTLLGETVLDNTMGSGSTGVACVNTQRNFIGIEKDANYYDIACSRIKQAQQQLRLIEEET
jgi:site-specific DNA-methyltransferase (adenine-specific)